MSWKLAIRNFTRLARYDEKQALADELRKVFDQLYVTLRVEMDRFVQDMKVGGHRLGQRERQRAGAYHQGLSRGLMVAALVFRQFGMTMPEPVTKPKPEAEKEELPPTEPDIRKEEANAKP